MSEVDVRVDKWLQIARVFKTRSLATRACVLGRVQVNDQVSKPHRKLAVDDRIEVEKGEWTQVLVVKELRDKPLPKAEAARLYEDLSPPKPQRDAVTRILLTGAPRRDPGAGRPTKKQRRALDKLKEGP